MLSAVEGERPATRPASENGPRFAVIGGGLLGMTLALRLAQAGRGVTLYEAASEWGGLASAWEIGGVRWDRHYHVTLASDSATRTILRELGLEDEMRWVKTRTALASKGELHPLDDALDFLRLPLLGPIEKMRLAGTIVWASRLKDWRRLEQIPVETWLRRCSGRGTFEKLWRPLLESKLGANWRRSSAAFLWTTIQRLYAARRSGLKEEQLGYVPGGYARVLQRFAEHLAAAGVALHSGSPVESVREDGGALQVRVAGSDTEERFERVVITSTPGTAARLLPQLGEEERARYACVPYQGIVCASLLLRRPLSGAYLTYLTDPGLPFTGVVEMTAFVDPERFGGRHLVYLPRYTTESDPAFEWSDAEVRERFFSALVRLHPTLTEDDLLELRVSRVREVFPVPVLGYSTRLPPEEPSIPGVHVINSARILNGTLNVNETVSLAEDRARKLAALPAPGVR